MATVLVRYWAAARAAAGVAEERLDGVTLADVVLAARAAHGEELGRVLDRCAFLVDEVRARPETVLADSAVVEVLPPFAGGAADGVVRNRPVPGNVGAEPFTAGICLGLALTCFVAALYGPAFVAAAVLLVQLVLLAGWFGVTGVPSERGGIVVAAAIAVTADVLLVVRDSEPVLAPVAWLLGPALLAAFAAQLARRDGRPRLVASLTATVAGTVLVALAALLIPAAEQRGDVLLVAAALAGAAVGAVVASVALPARPSAGVRVLVATVVAVGVGVGAALAVGSARSDAVGVVAGAVVAGLSGLLSVTAVRLVCSPLAGSRRGERLAVAGALPLVLAAPVGYIAGLLVPR